MLLLYSDFVYPFIHFFPHNRGQVVKVTGSERNPNILLPAKLFISFLKLKLNASRLESHQKASFSDVQITISDSF